MADVSAYTGLITSEHSNKPKFMAMVAAVAGCFVDQQNFLESMPEAFDLDQAVGNQLDILGLWIGLPRNIAIPIDNVYFAWDTAGQGWDEGIWKTPSDPTVGVSVLPDTSYRLLLRAKIGANHWDGSMANSVAILNAVFNPDGLSAVITDNQNMTMTVTICGGQLSALDRALISGGYIPVRPVGVSVNFIFNIYNLFLNGTFALDGSETLDGFHA